MLLNNKILSDPLSEKTLPLFAQKLSISHFSPTQFALPDSAWLFKYIYLTQEQRRLLLKSNSAMEAGKRVGDALQRHLAEKIYKLNPLTKKVAPTTNEKISLDNAIQEQLEIFKDYNPVDDKDSDKKQKYLEEVPEIIRHAFNGLKELAIESPITCERQVSITAESLKSSYISSPTLPTVGRIDFDFGSNQMSIGENPTSAGDIDTSVSMDAFLPHKIVELKTKYSRLGKIKKDGSRSFLVSPTPSIASFNHAVQCAVYAAHWQFKVPVYLLYATQGGYQIFDSTNCKHLTVEGMKKNIQIMNRTFMRREKILSQFQDLSRNEIIEHAVELIDPNFDHPFAFNGLPEDLLKEAKDLWKVN
tara:strand:+ start:4437 stop:5516 length:1080 start_codon:yes stop_codon:yes gene_type:complete